MWCDRGSIRTGCKMLFIDKTRLLFPSGRSQVVSMGTYKGGEEEIKAYSFQLACMLDTQATTAFRVRAGENADGSERYIPVRVALKYLVGDHHFLFIALNLKCSSSNYCDLGSNMRKDQYGRQAYCDPETMPRRRLRLTFGDVEDDRADMYTELDTRLAEWRDEHTTEPTYENTLLRLFMHIPFSIT
jgi:hypothetical protein